MKIIKTGTTYKVYGEDLVVLDNLPAQVYKIGFGQFTGFFLEKQSDLEIKENTIYGVHEQKANKVLNRFQKVSKNLGVILSGDKGIGKSLFARILANKAIEHGIPVVLVDKYIPGIGDFINEIQNEIMVLFDEFDKTFKIDDDDPQAQMLSLFDGISNGKKLFVITCNKFSNLNEYLINRPGRFHFHFRFEYPTSDEIRNYLHDKLDSKYYSEIDKVINFSKKTKLNYDCLSAISIELNEGDSFEDAIRDLNIMNDFASNKNMYNLKVHTKEGVVFSKSNVLLNLFKNEQLSTWLMDNDGNDNISITFNPQNIYYDETKDYFIAPKNEFKVSIDDERLLEKYKKSKNLDYEYLEISLSYGQDYHYNLY